MLNEATTDKLCEMQLDTIAEILRNQGGDPVFTALSFEERLGLLIDAKWSARRRRLLKKCL